MSIQNRIARLEGSDGPPEKLIVVVYGPDGRAVKGSNPEIIGMNAEDIAAHYASENIVLLNVIYRGAVFIPDNGRD
jgi:hypothetical protein